MEVIFSRKAGAVLAALLFLQSGAKAADDVTAATDRTEVMVVSGSRQAENLVVTPLNISVIDEQRIKDKVAQHPSEILSTVSGVWISRGDGQEHLTAIRSPVFSGSGACANFFIAEDGIAVRASGFCNVNQLFDTHYELAEKVEIFRGPNSSVYGSNALFGGMVFFTPQLKKRETISLAAGSYDNYRLSWKISNLNHGLFASLRHDQGYRDDTDVQQQKLGYKNRFENGDWLSVNTLQINNLEQNTAGFIGGENAYKNKALAKTNSNPEAYRNAQSFRAASHNTLQLNNNNTLRISPYARRHDMEFLMHFLPWQPVEKNAHQSFGIQNLWTHQYNDKLSIFTGLDSEYTHASLHESQSLPAPFNQQNFPQGEHYDYQVRSFSYSLFNQIKYELSDNLSLSSSVRRDHIRYDYHNNLTDGFACEPEANACRFFRPEDRKDNFNFSSYRWALLYKLNQHSAIYGNSSRAFRAPQAAELYSAQTNASNMLDEVELNGIEVGIKSNQQRFSYQLALYDMQQSRGIYQNSERIYLTGTETSHQGIEYEIQYQPHPSLQLGLSGNWAKHRYDNSPDALGITQNIHGNDIDTAPRKTNSLNIRWLANSKTRLSASVEQMGQYYLDPENDSEYQGHTLIDLAAQYLVSSRISVNFLLKNAADTRYAERADVAFGEPRYFPGLPRRFVLEWTFRAGL